MAEDFERQEIMNALKHIVALALIALAFAGCGVRGDPKPPVQLTTQQ
jgi:predicted small lipoprotein YifL